MFQNHSSKYVFLLFFSAFLFSNESYSQAFTSIWNTTQIGSSLDNQITIPTNPAFTYEYTVNWGDGNTDNLVTGNITHTYATPGIYTVEITGTFPAIYFNNQGDRRKIIEITDWGNIQWQSMDSAFYGCENLNFDAIAPPDLSQVTTMKWMFRNAANFNGILNNWNIINVTDISGMFWNASTFNRPLDNWDTDNVTDMSDLFNDADNFNEPLDSWNTSNVTTMARTFRFAFDFDQNLSTWDVSNVTDMVEMFWVTDINFPMNQWDVSNVTDMSRMFANTPYNQPLDSWDVSNVTTMFSMFSNAQFNQPIASWDVSSVTNMSSMFNSNTQFNQPLDGWDVSNVTNMASMFAGFSSILTTFNQPLPSWDVSNVENMANMFASSQFNQPLEQWNVANVTNMAGMFNRAENFDQPLQGWNVSNVTRMENMFFQAFSFNQPLDNWDVSQVVDMESMFRQATVFNQPLPNWDVTSVTDMRSMFRQAPAFNQNLGIWDISTVTQMNIMLSNCGMSEENYDNTLIGWEGQTVQDNITLGANNLLYCDGRFARQDLIDNHNWTFVEDIINCDFVLCTSFISPLDGDTEVPANFNLVWEANPVATAYKITVTVNDGATITTLLNDFNVGNTTEYDFPVDFNVGDVVTALVVPTNAEGDATGCTPITFTIVAPWNTSPDSFILTYDTSITYSGSTPANQLEILRNSSFDYDYSIDWGDGQFNNNVTNTITHTYLTPGVYTIAIKGQYPSHYYNSSTADGRKLLTIEQWGTIAWESMHQSFYYCHNMTYNATDVPDLSLVTDMSEMFREALLFNGAINNWDVSNVVNMTSLFEEAESFNQPLDGWNVSNVTSTAEMFSRAILFNQNIENWDVSNVVNMSRMFDGFVDDMAFNQPLNDWDVSNVTLMSRLFRRCINFNQPLDLWQVDNVVSTDGMFSNAVSFAQNLNGWNVANVLNMNYMFFNADSFNTPLDQWNTSSVTNMAGMFSNTALFNQSLNNWDVSNVLDMSFMFASAQSFNQPLSEWNTAQVRDMESMFEDTLVFNQNINAQSNNRWNVSNVLTMESMFEDAVLFDQPLSDWDVNSVVNMISMFENAQVFNQPINDWDVSAVANMSSMFRNAQLFDQPLDNWNVSSVTLMPFMFDGAQVFNQNINTWDVSSVTNTQAMFRNATVFNQPLGDWNTGEFLNTSEMFRGASSFNQNIDTWNTSFVTTMVSMFQDAVVFNEPLTSWNVASVTSMLRMFSGATSFNQNIDAWNTRAVTNMQEMFDEATAFNQPLNNWRVANVTTMESMFRLATSFNQNLDEWDLETVSLRRMFLNASSFNQYLGDWDMSQVNNLQNMLDNSALSRENYDNTLIAWSEQNLPSGLTFGALTLPYCDAFEERADIIATYGWNIVGDVLDCPIPLCTTLTSPEDGDVDVPVNTNINWEPTTFARGYRLTVTTDPGNVPVVTNLDIIDETSYNFAADFNLGDIVNVTLIPFNNAGEATGCSTESFTITTTGGATVPDCTSITFPLDGALDVEVDTIINWDPIANADGYFINIGTNVGGTDITNNENVGNVTTYTPPTDLPEDTLIYVTIIPFNDLGNATSCSSQSFTTEIIPTPPDCTTVTIPADGAIDVEVNTDISWDAVPTATGYLLSIGTTAGGIEILNNVDVANMTTYDIPFDLEEDRQFFVTVIPYNNIGDASGCSESTFTTETPTSVIAVCSDFTLALDATGNATLLPTDIDGGSSNPDGPFTLSVDTTSFTCDDLGENTVTLTATDNNGGSTSCSATVTVVDTTAPMVVCEDITVMLDANGNVTILAADVDNNSSDNCAITSLTIDVDTFDCTNLGANTVTLTATDSSNNTNSCTATVTVVENDLPTAICQDITVSIDASGNASITADQIDNGSFFGCNNTNVNLSLDTTSFDCTNLGANTVTLTAENNGETATCTATVTVTDVLPPTTICQNITVTLDASGNAAITADQIDNGSTDNCEITSFSLDVDTFTCDDLGDNLVTVMMSDASGNQSDCTALVTVLENPMPTAVCQNITVSLDALGQATITAEQIDNGSFYGCDNTNVSLSIDISDFNCSNLGANTVTLTATNNGESSTCTAIVTVIDDIAPVANCQNISVTLDIDGNATITPEQINNGSTDNCEISTISLDNETFTCANLGENTVTLTVIDSSGNEASCTAVVTVLENETPTAICQNITLPLDENGQATLLAEQINNGSFYGCGATEVTLSTDVTAFTCENIGANTVTLTVERNGFTDSCTAIVTIVDTVPPVAVCNNITIQLDTTGNASIDASMIDAGSTDNCGIASLEIDTTNFTCDNIGDNTITLTVTDESGNIATCQSIVTVESTGIPTAVCQDATITLNPSGNTTIDPNIIDGGSTDACGGTDITLSVFPPFLDCDDFGETEVTLIVTSLEGATAECTATLTVEAPVVTPVAVCQNLTVTLNSEGIGTITPNDIDGGSTALFCGGGLSIDIDTFTCEDAGTVVPVTLTATNANGFTDSCVANVFVVDTLDPVIICPEETVILAELAPYELPDFSTTGLVIIEDNCDTEIVYEQLPPAGTLVDEGETVINVTATDPSGNSASCSFTIFVDPSLEVISAKEALIQLEIFPNPTDANITLLNPQEIVISSVSLYDVTGRLVKQWNIQDQFIEYNFDLSTLASASYFMSVESTTAQKTFQVIKR